MYKISAKDGKYDTHKKIKNDLVVEKWLDCAD
jgi:hypothetical protein